MGFSSSQREGRSIKGWGRSQRIAVEGEREPSLVSRRRHRLARAHKLGHRVHQRVRLLQVRAVAALVHPHQLCIGQGVDEALRVVGAAVG